MDELTFIELCIFYATRIFISMIITFINACYRLN